MLWFILAAAVLLLAALGVMLRPLLRRSAEPDAGLRDSDIYRRQIAEIDADIAAGNLTAEEAGIARTEVTRRLLIAADREAGETGPQRKTSPRLIVASVAGVIALGSVCIYLVAGRPDAVDGSAQRAARAATAPPTSVDLAQAVTMLQNRLKHDPKSLEGWILLGRTMVTLQRFDEAADAYRKAIALSPNDAALHPQLGEILTLKAGGVVTPDAMQEFAQTGDDPRSRYYVAVAAAQKGDTKGAIAQFQSLLASSPADAPWRGLVTQRIAELQGGGATAPGAQAQGGPPAPEPSVTAGPGPSQADMAAAAQMSPEARMEMIRTMVDRLAARMAQNPNDKTGWERLARAYDVLGETDKATEARAHAAAIKPEDDRASAAEAGAGQ